MPQTLLALLALTLASLLAFNQKQLTMRSYRATIANEMGLAAAGTSQHLMELIGGRSFDEQSTPVRVFQAGGVPTGSSSFSGSDTFDDDRGDLGCNLMNPSLTPECDDVDDLDGIRDAIAVAELSDGRVIPFEVDVDVDYVTSPGDSVAVSTPTLHKRVSMTLRSDHPLAPDGGVLTITRVVSYDPIKADADMETMCGSIGEEGSPCESPGGGTIED